MRHAIARSSLERLLGAVRKTWTTLNRKAHFGNGVQEELPYVVAFLHNFVKRHRPSELEGVRAEPTSRAERDRLIQRLRQRAADTEPDQPFAADDDDEGLGFFEPMHTLRDQIATEMWADYQAEFKHASAHREYTAFTTEFMALYSPDD